MVSKIVNIVTKELSRLQRDLLLEHFLALYAEDRRLLPVNA